MVKLHRRELSIAISEWKRLTNLKENHSMGNTAAARSKPASATNKPQKNNPAVSIDGKHGIDLLHDPVLNKATAYTEAERQALGLVGLVPDVSESIQTQLSRVLLQLKEKATDL